MLPRMRIVVAALVGLALAAGSLRADLTDSLKQGTPDLKSATALAFGPDGVLFVGDPRGGAIFAIDTGDRPTSPATGGLKIDRVDEKIAAMLGTNAKNILLNDLAVNPASGKAYLAVSRGTGQDAAPVLVRADQSGKIEELSTKDVKFSRVALPNVSDKRRQEAITQLGHIDGRVIVAGLSNDTFSSRLRSIPFPFKDADTGSSVEIYHGAHGQFETKSPIRTFLTYEIAGQPYLLAAYQCTPLVKIPIADLKPGAHVKGTTIAELGNGNKPLDMIAYQKDGKDYLLVANNTRGVMKVSTESIDSIAGITARVSGTAGLKYETIKDLKGVEQLAKLDKTHAALLIKTSDGSRNLDTIELP